jgi:prevent-host-death family protein
VSLLGCHAAPGVGCDMPASSSIIVPGYLDVRHSYVVRVLHCRDTMKTVSARQANHAFSELLSRVERGEEILITKRSKPVALLSPYHPPRLTPERQAAVNHAIEVMRKGCAWARRCEVSREMRCTKVRGHRAPCVFLRGEPKGWRRRGSWYQS